MKTNMTSNPKQTLNITGLNAKSPGKKMLKIDLSAVIDDISANTSQRSYEEDTKKSSKKDEAPLPKLNI